ncbi:helix-turn-helix domain-containing protein [Pseudomonas sp. TTU2014-080ASC]|jgi:hypothetical protein|uniref:helix-turn-helix domain-containing protein n=1 Tax=Pseudomonas sp. TTU2014-080ASC TaxID=1729724 RepID=UPI0007188136|nr:hypothetical protein [Pseudomonas sp. TTU2014-080ASC]KRW60980.1 hypothetical protein AO726_06470 [Pseudomonas sp. TTU2014-080ASC]
MRPSRLFRSCVFLLLSALGMLLPAHAAMAITPQEMVQVQASRATSSLMMLRGEGFQTRQLEILEADLGALNKAVAELPQGSESLSKAHEELVKQIRLGISFGPNEEDMPWRYPSDLSLALLAVLSEARKLAEPGQSELAAQVEYLSVQYMSRAYLGSFETAREQPDTYLGQDERKIVPAVDQELKSLSVKDNPELNKLITRWDYLRAALVDLNSQSNTLQSASGRPFAPLTVYRHTRSFTNQWMAKN